MSDLISCSQEEVKERRRKEKRSMIVFITLPRVKYFNSQARYSVMVLNVGRSNQRTRPPIDGTEGVDRRTDYCRHGNSIAYTISSCITRLKRIQKIANLQIHSDEQNTCFTGWVISSLFSSLFIFFIVASRLDLWKRATFSKEECDFLVAFLSMRIISVDDKCLFAFPCSNVIFETVGEYGLGFINGGSRRLRLKVMCNTRSGRFP